MEPIQGCESYVLTGADLYLQLTYLLQNSLSGNSKTLMVLNVSPLSAHLGETLCSLRFATKVSKVFQVDAIDGKVRGIGEQYYDRDG